MDPSVLQFICLIILVFLSSFFSSAETALTTVNKIRMRSMADEGNKRAQTVVSVTDDPGKMLSAILIGNNIVNISASALATTWTTKVFGSQYIGYCTGILTLVILITGEVTPKTLATIRSESMSLFFAPIISFLMWLFTPVIWIINNVSMVLLFLMRVNPKDKQAAITETELRTIVEVSHEEGVIETQEKKMINNVFDFGDSQARDVMIPRIDMKFADIDNTYQEIIEIFRKEKYTRLPVFEGTTDNVVGIINVKDLLLYDNHEDFNVRDILREPYYAYEFKKTSELMDELRKTSNNISIVLDEYGSTVGMITLEDLLEEIVGDIRDEYDDDEKDLIEKIGEGEYIVAGMTKLDDLNELLDIELESEEYDSIGGLVIELLDRLPEEGDTVFAQGYEFRVNVVEKNRIESVQIIAKTQESVISEEDASIPETDNLEDLESVAEQAQ